MDGLGKLTEDLLRLEPKPPSLIFRGATFLGLGFLASGTRGLPLGFLRALGPKSQGEENNAFSTQLVSHLQLSKLFSHSQPRSHRTPTPLSPTLSATPGPHQHPLPPHPISPLPSLVLALRIGTSTGGGGGATSVAVTMLSTTATAAAAAAATEAPELPLKGLLVLNSRHLAPKTIIIFETAILGFLAAMRGLVGQWNRAKKKRLRIKGEENQ